MRSIQGFFLLANELWNVRLSKPTPDKNTYLGKRKQSYLIYNPTHFLRGII